MLLVRYFTKTFIRKSESCDFKKVKSNRLFLGRIKRKIKNTAKAQEMVCLRERRHRWCWLDVLWLRNVNKNKNTRYKINKYYWLIEKFNETRWDIICFAITYNAMVYHFELWIIICHIYSVEWNISYRYKYRFKL